MAMKVRFVVPLVMAALLSWSALVLAQSNRGAIEGIVTDPQGASVPRVAVTITAVDTGVATTTQTDSAGYYRVIDLLPGEYRASFVLAGFTTQEVLNIEVRAAGTTRTDTQLKLGSTATQVTVSAAVTVINTQAANGGTALEQRSITEIPVNGRDLLQLVNLLPGVSSTIGPPGTTFGFNSQFGTFPDPTGAMQSAIAVNGGIAGSNAWLVDGNLNHSPWGENPVITPSPDAVMEFQVISSAFAPEYGRMSGGVFNEVLKSGTDAYHGNLYEYVRNDATNARNPFTSIAANGQIIKSRQLRFNNFGGTLGGPVRIPHIYDGRNKTFFFTSVDQQILHLIGQNTFTVPDAAMRAGNFSEDPNAAKYGIWDPYSTVGPDPVTGLYTRTAFGTPAAGFPNGCLNTVVEANPGVTTCNFATQIPSNRIDSVANWFMGQFPQPNFNSPTSSCPVGINGYKTCGNFLGPVASLQDPRNSSVKIDHNWSEKSRFFGEWLYDPIHYANFMTPWVGPTHPVQGFNSDHNFDMLNQVYSFGNTYSLSPSLINEFRASFSRQSTSTHPAKPGPESLTGQAAVEQELGPSQIPVRQLTPVPDWAVTMPDGGGNVTWGPDGWNNIYLAGEAYTFKDDLTKIHGRHTIKAGITYRLEHNAFGYDVPTDLDFYGSLTQDPTTGFGGGSGMAQFLLGAVGANGSFSGKQALPYPRERYWAFYGQDDWRVTKNFTLNFGLRYDIYGKFETRWVWNANWCPHEMDSRTGLPGEPCYYPGDILPPNWNSLGPRLNFSWAPGGDRKTVIRGGYDILYGNSANAQNMNGEAGALVETGWYDLDTYVGTWLGSACGPPTSNAYCPAFQLDNTTTNKGNYLAHPLLGAFPAAQKAMYLGYAAGMEWYKSTGHDPTTEQWSLTIQRELPGHIAIEAGYIGAHSTHEPGPEFESVPGYYLSTANKLQYKNGINAQAPIANYYSGQTAQELACVYDNACSGSIAGLTLPLSVLLLPNPFYPGGIGDAVDYDGTAAYNSLNVRVQKRFSNGMHFLAAYTNSKTIQNSQMNSLFFEYWDPVHSVATGIIGGRAGTQTYSEYRFLYQDPDNRKADRTISGQDIPQIFNLAGTYELPFGHNKPFLNQKGPLNQIVGGWQVSGTFNAQDGIPMRIGCPSDSVTGRCDGVGNPMVAGGRSKAAREAQWWNPAAFAPAFGTDQTFWANYSSNDPRAWQFGTDAVIDSRARAPGFWNLDSALSKRFHVTEGDYFDFRWEMFNALNHMNLALPNANWCLPLAAGGTPDRVHQAGCAFGRITNIQTDPRSMQFALKFVF